MEKSRGEFFVQEARRRSRCCPRGLRGTRQVDSTWLQDTKRGGKSLNRALAFPGLSPIGIRYGEQGGQCMLIARSKCLSNGRITCLSFFLFSFSFSSLHASTLTFRPGRISSTLSYKATALRTFGPETPASIFAVIHSLFDFNCFFSATPCISLPICRAGGAEASLQGGSSQTPEMRSCLNHH